MVAALLAAVSSLTKMTVIAARGGHTCALVTGGTFACWGANTCGELGNGPTTVSPTPIAVDGL